MYQQPTVSKEVHPTNSRPVFTGSMAMPVRQPCRGKLPDPPPTAAKPTPLSPRGSDTHRFLFPQEVMPQNHLGMGAATASVCWLYTEIIGRASAPLAQRTRTQGV